MNTTTSQKLRIGIFTVAGIVLLVGGIFFIGSKKNLFSDTFTVHGIFKNTGGLQAGNNVRFGGVNVGTVKSIQILADTVVRVDLVIQSKMREFIKNDAVAAVGSDGLMGDKLLTIAPGSPGAQPLKDGSQIKTEEPMDIGAVVTRFTNVAANAEIITGALADMSVQLKSGNGSISRLIYRDDLARGLEGTMRNAERITASMQGIATRVQSGQGSIGELVYTDNLARSLDRTVGSANTALGTVNDAAYNFSENMRALQGNYFFRGYFKRKKKAGDDSARTQVVVPADGKTGDDDEDDLSDAELKQMRDDADQELLRRAEKRGGK